MFKRFLIFTSIIMTTAICHNAEAATVLWFGSDGSSNYAYRIEDLEVLGGTYDIDFRLASYNTLYVGGFDTPAQADAIAVVNAINAALNAEQDSIGKYLIIQDSTNNSTKTNIFSIPYMGDGTVDTQKGKLSSEGTWYLFGAEVYPPNWTNMYAKMEVVPIPGAVWLFGSGLIGIVGIRRKFKN